MSLAKLDRVDGEESETLLRTPNLNSVVDEAIEGGNLGSEAPEALVDLGSVAHAEWEGAEFGRRRSIGGANGRGSKEIARVIRTAGDLEKRLSLRLVDVVIVEGDLAIDVVDGAAQGEKVSLGETLTDSPTHYLTTSLRRDEVGLMVDSTSSLDDSESTSSRILTSLPRRTEGLLHGKTTSWPS